MALLRKMESGNRRDQSLAEIIQQKILEYLSDPEYERLLQHTYVDDIKRVARCLALSLATFQPLGCLVAHITRLAPLVTNKLQ